MRRQARRFAGLDIFGPEVTGVGDDIDCFNSEDFARGLRFTVARSGDVMFDVVGRMARRSASVAIVISGGGRPRAKHVTGVITQEQIGNSVLESAQPYH